MSTGDRPPSTDEATAVTAVPGLGQADWTGEAAARWAARADRIETMLAPVDDILLPAAAIEPGERVLDVGCGRGVTTRAAAVATGPTGAVTGIDIAAGLIAEAAAVDVPALAAPVEWITADAATHPFSAESIDVVVSRFGTIFFDDPVTAFTNLHHATRPGGRLVTAVWQRQDASEFQTLAMDVAVTVAARHGVELHRPPPDAGPFAYGDPPRTTAILERAGWVDVTVTPHDLMLYVGGPGTAPEEAVEMGRQFGPLGLLLQDAPADVAAAVAEALTEELRSRWDGTGTPLQAAIAIVTACRR